MPGLATDIWEFRPAQNKPNSGGGFDTASGGTDYSDQDAAQLQLTDLATAGIGVTTLTSVTGGFTSAMVGNYIQIRSGTNVVAGFYRVTVHTDTNTVTLDRAPDDGVGGIASGAGDLGGALDILIDSFFNGAGSAIVPGSTIYLKNDETMTLIGNVSTGLDGTALLPITIEGYNASRGDNPIGANRPTIAAGANTFNLDDWWVFKNIIGTTTSFIGFSGDTAIRFENVKVTNSSVEANRDALNVFSKSRIIACEMISTNGQCIAFTSGANKVINCYLHDSLDGILNSTADSAVITGCVIDTCTNGILATTTATDVVVSNNTIYNCTTAITAGTGNVAWTIYNNIFDANTTGVSWGDADRSLYMDYNVWDNGTDVVNVVKGDHAITGDPGLTDPANGDFTLGSGSNALLAGLDLTDVGVTGAYKWNIGVDQDDVVAGGGVSLPLTRRNTLIGR